MTNFERIGERAQNLKTEAESVKKRAENIIAHAGSKDLDQMKVAVEEAQYCG